MTALAVAASTFLGTGSRIDETAASVLVAAGFWVATVLQLRQSQRRQHTVELVTGFQSADALSAADIWMAARITEHRSVDVDIPAEDASRGTGSTHRSHGTAARARAAAMEPGHGDREHAYARQPPQRQHSCCRNGAR